MGWTDAVFLCLKTGLAFCHEVDNLCREGVSAQSHFWNRGNNITLMSRTSVKDVLKVMTLENWVVKDMIF